MAKIRIVFVLGKLDNGGTEGQFMETIRRLNRDRFEISVLAFPRHGKLREEIESLRIPLTCLGFSGLKGKFHPVAYWQLCALIWKMVRYFRCERPHIVQSYLFWANIYGCIAAKIAGVNIMITGRRGIVETYRMKWHYRWLNNLSNWWATLILTNSHFIRQHCLEHEKCIHAEKIAVIHNGIDCRRYNLKQRHNDIKHAFDIPPKHHVIGIVGNLRPCKGHSDFLQAASSVLHTHPQTVFVIVGRDGGIRSSLERFAEDLGIRGSIIFTGERNDIPSLLSMFDILVSSSLTESLSNAILEGMAAGKPVVATQVGGNPEIIEHERTGLLVAPGNAEQMAKAIVRLLDDAALRKTMGEYGRSKALAAFPMENMICQMETCYEKLLHIM